MSHSEGMLRVVEEEGDVNIKCGAFYVAAMIKSPGHGDETAEDNARRMVACWNACNHLSTERLEKFIGAETHRSMVTLINDKVDLTKQREVLLKELESAMNILWTHGERPKANRISDLIDSVKGGA